VAEEGIPFLLSLRDQMTAPLKLIKGALSAAKDQMRGLDTQILQLQKAQAQFASKGGKETAKVLGDQIKALSLQKREWAQVTVPFKEHVSEVEKANKAQKEQSGFLGAGKKLLGEFAPKVKEAGANMGEMGIAAGVATGGVMIAVEAVGEMLSAVKELAIGLADATLKLIEFTSKSAALREKMVANFTILRNNAVEGRATFDMLANIAARAHVSQEKTLNYGKELLQAGVKPNLELQRSVRAITDLSKAGTEEQANKLKGIIERASKTRIGPSGQKLAGTFGVSAEELTELGLSMDDYAKAVGARLHKVVTAQDIAWGRVRISADTGIAAINDAITGGKIGATARGMFGGLDEVMERAKTTFQNLFMDVDTGPLMQALHELLDIFDPLTESGKNAKSGITNMMNSIIKLAGKVVHEFTLGFLKMENELLKLYLFSIPAIKAFKEFWKTHDGLGKLKMLLEGIVVIMAILAVTTFIAFLPLIILIGTISPSKEFAKLGKFSAQGFEDGFNAMAGKGLAIASPGGLAVAGGGGAATTNLMLGGVTINVDGSKNPQETASFLENQLADIFERAMLERGE